jgi:hypothetical protein
MTEHPYDGLLSRIQIINGQPHAAASLDGRISFKDEAICQFSSPPYHGDLPGVQAMPIQAHNGPQPTRRQIDCSTHKQMLHCPKRRRKNWRRAHDCEKVEDNIRALQSTR